MRVLVTGHKGYIGAHLVDLLKQHGHSVTGVDLDLFGGCAWEPSTPADRELIADVRTLDPRVVEGHDAVCHLAAISNDPMGDLNEELTLSVNRDASIRLAEVCQRVGVPRFLFSGSCSVYGKGATLDLAEDAELNPLTAYARSKIETEAAVRPMADRDFSPVYLRNATAYGHSPALRIDLVVNNLLACAHAMGEIRIMSDGSPWRPLTHCRDIAAAFVACLEAPRERLHNVAVNIGGNAENYQVRDVADEVRRLVPEAEITYTGEVGADPRDYRVNFDLLGRLLPEFRLHYSLRSGMEELHEAYRRHGFTAEDFSGPQFVRLRTLSGRMHLLDLPRAA
jgi:nucleoside-diphosphate-sugar epimerase